MTTDPAMIPAGYLLKRIVPPPGWRGPIDPPVRRVASVSSCVNDTLADPQDFLRHNSFGLANSPGVLADIVGQEGIDTAGATLFYYEAYPTALESDGWTFDTSTVCSPPFARSTVIADAVEPPDGPTLPVLLGYDVVVFGDWLEHSPLSCNGIAGEIPVNADCLIATLDDALSAIVNGAFGGGCEDGAYTVFAVYRVAEFC